MQEPEDLDRLMRLAQRRQLVVSDKWAPVEIVLLPGESAAIVATHEFVADLGKFKDKRLAVLVVVADEHNVTRCLVRVAHPAQRVILDGLEDLGRYVKTIAGEEGVDALEARLEALLDVQCNEHGEMSEAAEAALFAGRYSAGEGPRLSARTLLDFFVLNEQLGYQADPDGAVRYLLDLAYRVGVAVGEAGYPDAARRTGGLTRGQQQSEDAEAWYRPFLAWLQVEVDRENSRRASPMSLDDIVEWARDRWPVGGFGSEAEPPPWSTIAGAISWGRRNDLFSRPPAKRGRRRKSTGSAKLN